ncbi:hypothetical protein ACS0TY_033375 [Phlomoides rotata]
MSFNYFESSALNFYRFRLEVWVDDGKDSTTFVIFDKDAKQMIKTTAAEVMTEMGENSVKDGHDRAPASVLNIVGKMYKFQVKITPYNFRAKYQSFTVSRILGDISNLEAEEHHQKKKKW